jgi:hypothetical protein
MANWVASLPLGLVVLFVLVTMIMAALAGHFIRRAQIRRGKVKEDHSQEGYLVGSMIGVLALLLAFTFGMALDRYEERRHLVVQEANAIGTSYLRAQLLDEPHRSRLSNLLVTYTDNRITLASASPAEVGEQLASNDRLLIEIWAAIVAARDSAAAHSVSVPLLNTYNELIDLDAERKVARQVRVPAPVMMLLYGFLLITGAVIGYVLEERRARVGAFVFFLLLSLYVGIIIDLNRPVSGSIQESQEPMLMLKSSLEAQPPRAFDKFASPGASP